MHLTPIKANMTELSHGWYTTLFSYKTPVATIFNYGNEIVAYQTEKKWRSYHFTPYYTMVRNVP